MASRCFETPLGWFRVAEDADGLVSARFLDLPPEAPEEDDGRRLRQAEAMLRAYFAGEGREFDLPLHPRGTEFQLAVWRELGQIGYGRTRTYGEIAARLGSPGAARAVGMACGRNPLWVLVPCHRAVGRGGALTGYAGGLERKRALLALEGGKAHG